VKMQNGMARRGEQKEKQTQTHAQYSFPNSIRLHRGRYAALSRIIIAYVPSAKEQLVELQH
jgi:hypothetical protein